MNIIEICEDISQHVIAFYGQVFTNLGQWSADFVVNHPGVIMFLTATFCVLLGAELVGLLIWAIKRSLG